MGVTETISPRTNFEAALRASPWRARTNCAASSGHLGVRVTQATLSRDLRELRLVKTVEGYRPLSAAAEEASPLPGSGARAEGIFAGYPARAEHARAEDASQRRAAARGGGGRGALERSRRHAGGRRHRSAHYDIAQRLQDDSETHRGNASMSDPARVAVVGATGYAGYELARLLLRHPNVEHADIFSAREPR